MASCSRATVECPGRVVGAARSASLTPLSLLNMNQSQAVEKFLNGEFICVGEYRMSKSEMLNWRDKQNGQAKSAPMLRHTVEVGNVSLTLNERVPDQTKLEDIRVPFVKGEIVLVHLDELQSSKGVVSGRGRLEKLTRSPDKAASVGRAPGS